jgi:hypothetical protein
MDPKRNDTRLSDEELGRLEPLAREVPNIDSAIGKKRDALVQEGSALESHRAKKNSSRKLGNEPYA